MTVTVRTNLPDFRRQLAALGERFERRLAQRAARAAGRIFRDSARRRAPVLRAPSVNRIAGVLRSAIYVGRSRESRKGKLVFRVGVRATAGQVKKGRDPFYWRFLEGGWTPRGRGRKFTGGVRSRALQRSRALKAGGRKVSYPFLAPAFAADKERALQAFVKTMEDGIAEESRGLS